MMPRVLRATALVIALAALLDPAITSTRSSRPIVAIVPADSAQNSAQAARVARELSKTLTIVPAPFAGAAGTVIVGDHLPHATLAGPVFALLPEQPDRFVTLEAVSAPARAPVESRVPVSAALDVRGSPGDTVTVTLRLGELVVDRMRQALNAQQTRLQAALSFVPAAEGAAHLRVSAELAGAAPAHGDLVVQAMQQRWSILFFDARPSWMSRFVRRAIESDARFAVTSRVITSRNISTAAGRAPAVLAGAAALTPFDVVVVGAPEALNERDISGLNAFLRQQGGAVVLLFDHNASGTFERLTQVARWQASSAARAFAVTASTDSVALQTSQARWPSVLPAGARALALDSAGHPVLWRSRAGAGRLVVSGALDAWKFRDPAVSGFDQFWQSLIAATADQVPAALDVRLEESVLTAGAASDVVVTVRAAALADLPVRASASAALVSAQGRINVRLWPDGAPGRLRGTVRAPAAPGRYSLVVESAGTTTTVPLVVLTAKKTARPPGRDLLNAVVTAQGGRSFSHNQLGDLKTALLTAVQPAPRRETWHPMRSAWWILPFALALAAEWLLLRRRRSLTRP